MRAQRNPYDRVSEVRIARERSSKSAVRAALQSRNNGLTGLAQRVRKALESEPGPLFRISARFAIVHMPRAEARHASE